MTTDEAHDDTPADDWDDTDVPEGEELEELERLRAKLGLANGAPRRVIDGRYEILGRQGQGGMGVVYQAHDRRLDRDVALKLVRSRPFRDEDRLRERLAREAKALAKLDGHDHVVGVYDVGRHQDRIYFTMPYVQGLNLRQWQDEAPRQVDELIDVYLQAARGLSAAHELGIVHRDFKPGNVLVRATDHRILVADFGIAEAVSKFDTPPEGLEAVPDEAQRLTASGAVLGTLPYVAPERLPTLDQAPVRGVPASDQFSYCVALWEALAGELPFDARTPAQMLEAIERGPSGEGRIPVWLRSILRRGLRRDPDARFPTMAALIRAIERRRHRRRRRVIFAASVMLFIALFVSGFVAWTRAHAPLETRVACSVFSDSAARVWSDSRRQALLDRRDDGPETIDHVIAQLDALMERWVETGERGCVDGYTSAEAATEIECLEQWLRVAEDSIALLVEVDDVTAAPRAGEVVDRLLPPSLDFCAFTPPPVVDAELWRLTQATRAAALLGAGEQALALADRALERATTLADARAHTANFAEAYSARAEAFSRQRQYQAALHDFEDADVHAHLSGYREREISNQALWAKVRSLSGAALDYAKALEDLERKRKLILAVGSGPLRTRLEAELEDAAGFVEYRRDAYPEALAHHQRARELLAQLDDPVLLATTLNNLGAAHQMLDQLDEARASYTRARQTLAAAGVPPGHSTAVEVELNLGILDVELDRSTGFDHLASVARLSSGPRQLQALDQALTLAVNLGDEPRMREYAEELLAKLSSQPLTSASQARAKFDVATAFVHLGDPRGDELFATIDTLPPELVSPALGLRLRRSHVRALERRERCADAAVVLAGVDDYARRHGLVDPEFREWRTKRETAACELAPFQ
ncbi:Serine/threonine-protein kinase PrkC [Enhygromyxa salina]|uniref:Serine/threonine-protein kinase PrkC n=1 Tax=Enhygromyxa salina TaxID=215803 RepID=A0A2S9XEX4_9BACT|nr:serine/threonine-protein kinase [Enhygromyxa salina]PRP91412.1 Serine/threonine-protein kinase PrkC [Enhygromyxa salina]